MSLRFLKISKFSVVILISFGLMFCVSSKPEPPDYFGYTFLKCDTIQWHLDSRLEETSGLLKINGSFWTNNDSGNETALYQFDPLQGDVKRTLDISNVQNIDWEDMTQDDTHIYIGDFGNNLGNRRNLAIYKFPKTELDSTQVNDWQKIQFSLSDQTDFAYSYNHNFDIESLISYQDSLFIFTKNWTDKRCKLYVLPKMPGEYTARLISDFNTKGLITSATYNPENQVVVLLGYNYNRVNTPFVWILSNFKGNDFFSGSKNRFNIDLDRQTEGICHDTENAYVFTAEKGNEQSASSFRISL